MITLHIDSDTVEKGTICIDSIEKLLDLKKYLELSESPNCSIILQNLDKEDKAYCEKVIATMKSHASLIVYSFEPVSRALVSASSAVSKNFSIRKYKDEELILYRVSNPNLFKKLHELFSNMKR